MESLSLMPPEAFQPDIPRPALLSRLDTAVRLKQLTMLVSPGGFGKTCALRMFWQTVDSGKAWLDVQRHQDALRGAWRAACERTGANGLMILDGLERLRAEDVRWLNEQIARLPAAQRLIFAGRSSCGLDIAAWQVQGRLACFDARELALDEASWHTLALPDTAAAWAGWWGAARISLPARPGGEAALCDWLGSAWLAALSSAELDLLGNACWRPVATPDDWPGTPEHAPAHSWQAAVEIASPASTVPSSLHVAPALRPAILRWWRQTRAEAFQAGWQHSLAHCLTHQRYCKAVDILDSHPDRVVQAAQARAILHTAGWTLLFSRHRHAYRRLLDTLTPGEPDDTPFHVAWSLEHEKRPYAAEALIDAWKPAPGAVLQGIVFTLKAHAAHQSDDYLAALSHARSARHSFGTLAHPLACLAEIIESACLICLGELDTASRLLAHASAWAARDQLAWLELAACHRRALLATEAGEDEQALKRIADREAHARRCGLEDADTLDPTIRLKAWLDLRSGVAGSSSATSVQRLVKRFGDYWELPYRAIESCVCLWRNDLKLARQHVEHMERQLAERFICDKWRAETLLPRIWLYGRLADTDALQRLIDSKHHEDRPDTLFRDRQILYCEAAAYLLGRPLDLARIRAIAQRRRAQRCLALADLAERLLSLSEPTPTSLRAQLEISAERNALLDWIWLMPKAVTLLAPLVHARELAHAPQVRSLLQRLLATSVTHMPADDDIRSAPPQGLTPKEWQVLRAIGERMSNEQIAARLHVSLATIKTHINRIYAKLGLASREAAILRAHALSMLNEARPRTPTPDHTTKDNHADIP